MLLALREASAQRLRLAMTRSNHFGSIRGAIAPSAALITGGPGPVDARQSPLAVRHMPRAVSRVVLCPERSAVGLDVRDVVALVVLVHEGLDAHAAVCVPRAAGRQPP